MVIPKDLVQKLIIVNLDKQSYRTFRVTRISTFGFSTMDFKTIIMTCNRYCLTNLYIA